MAVLDTTLAKLSSQGASSTPPINMGGAHKTLLSKRIRHGLSDETRVTTYTQNPTVYRNLASTVQRLQEQDVIRCYTAHEPVTRRGRYPGQLAEIDDRPALFDRIDTASGDAFKLTYTLRR